MLSKRDKMLLGYLAKHNKPLWGGHLQRGEPISDPDMQRWIDSGLIEQVDKSGYILTEKARNLLTQ